MALEPRELVSSLGLRLRKDINLLVQVQRPGRAQMALCTAAGVDPAYARTHWLPESWSPIQTSGTLDRPAPVRQCPECAQHGYHTAAFQLPSIVECPWHGQRLIESCPRCRRPPVSAARRSRANGGLSLRLRSVRCRCGIGIDAAISIAARRGLASSLLALGPGPAHHSLSGSSRSRLPMARALPSPGGAPGRAAAGCHCS